MVYELSSSLPLLALYKDNEWFLLTTQDLTFNVIRILLTIFIRVQRLRVTPYYFPCRSEVSFSIILDITRGSQNSIKNSGFKSHPKNCWLGPTEIGTQIAGFRFQGANHYTMGPYARKRKSMKSIDHSGKPWYLLQSSSDTTKSVLCLTWNNAGLYHSTHGEHTTKSLKRKRNVCVNKSLQVQLITYNFCPVLKCNFCLLVFILCLAGALPFAI